MNEYKEGDLVEATKGADVIRGHIQIGCEGGSWVGATKWTLADLAVHAWTVALIERAPEPLPTEAGFFIDQVGGLWTLHPNGQWFHNSDGSMAVEWAADEMSSLRVGNLWPLKRLNVTS